jgi:hypothetical protein
MTGPGEGTENMSCDEIAERLTESARHEMEPGRVLRAHMLSCAGCRDRWEAEGNLTAQMKALRGEAWDQRSSAASREMLMERFARRNRPRVAQRWYWAFGAVAAALIAAVAVPGIEQRFAVPVVAVVQGVAVPGTESVEPEEIRTDAPLDPPSDPEAEGFIAVPFVPPLATGEMVRVVHTELNAAALANLGVSVDPAWTTQLPADVLFGEDGMPRAVRVSDLSSGSGGF